MAKNDGTLNFDTKIDSSGFQKGIDGIGGAAQKGLAVTGKVLGLAATAVTGLGAAAIKVGSEFESGMSQVQAISGTVAEKDLPAIVQQAKEMGLSFKEGTNATETAMNILAAKAKEMGATTKFTAAEAAEAMNYMAMAGWKAGDMIGGIEGIMNLAAASGEDLATTSDIVTDALTAFGLTAKDSGHFADILAAASSNANTNVGMMGETFKYVAPIAGTLGYSAEDTALAIGLMANSGIKASQAGTSLRSALTRLTNPTEEMESTMVKLGLATQQTAHVIDGAKVDKLQGQIADKTASMEKAQISYNSAVAKYGASSAQAQKAAISLETAKRKLADTSGKLGAAQAGTNKVIGITNTLMTDGKGNMNSFESVISQLRKSFKNLTQEEQAQAAATLFEQEAMSGMLAIINASDADFEKLSGAIKDCNGSAAEMAAIMQDNLQGQIVILQSNLEGLGVSLYETMQDSAKEAVKEVQGMVQQLQDAFNSGGFDGLVSAVGSVLAQVVQRIAEEAPAIITAAVSLVTSFCEGLRNAQGLGEAGASLIGSLVTGLLSCLGEIGATAVVLFAQLLAGLAQQLPQIIAAGKEAIGKFVTALVENGPSIASSALTIISTLFDALMGAIPQITSAGVELLGKLAQGISENLPLLIPAAMQALVQLSGSLRDSAGQLVDAGLKLIMVLAQSLIDALPVFIETIPTIVTNIAGIINDNAPKLLATGIELIGKLAMGIINAIPTLVANIPQIIQAIVAVFTAFNWLSLGSSIITFISNGVKSLATSIPNALKNIGQTAMDWLRAINWRTLGADLIDLILIGLQSLATAVPNLLKSIGTTAVAWFKGIDWLSLGVNIVKGIIAGITGALDGLWTAVKGLGSGILDGVKSFFGINSPSTVMAQQGDYLVQGLVNGIANMPARMGEYLTQTVQKVTQWGQQMFRAVQASVVNVVNAAVAIMGQLPGKIWIWLVNVVTKVTAWGQQMLSAAQTAVNRMITTVISLISQLPGKVWTWLVNVVTKVVQWGQQMLSAATTAMNNMISAIISILSTLAGKVASLLQDTIAKVVAWGTDLAAKGKAAAKGLYDAVVSGVSGLPAKMAEVGKEIVNGIWNGISSGWEWLKNKVAELAKSLLDAAKKALDVKSPSKKFRDEFGSWLMPGAVEGVKRSMPETLREMRAQAGELLAAMQGTVDASMGEVSLNAQSAGEGKALGSGGTVVYNDNHMEQENNYSVPVATPSETAKAQREAFRKMAGGVK